MASFFENAQDACYDMCSNNKSELTFLNIKEGKCLRNCVMKIGYLMPAVQKSFAQGDQPAFLAQQELTNELRAKYGAPKPNLSLIKDL